MSRDVRALPIPYLPARAVTAHAYLLPGGSPGLYRDRSGSGWHGVELYGLGAAGAVHPFAALSREAARQLGLILVREAARLAIAEGQAPDGFFCCPCNHYDHHANAGGLCPVEMTDPARAYCDDCWSPESGTQYKHSDGIARVEKMLDDHAREYEADHASA